MRQPTSNQQPSLRRLDLESLLRFGAPQIVSRGRLYYAQQRAEVTEADDESATILVTGSRWPHYTVEMWLDPDQPDKLVHLECDCPYAEDNPRTVCKHKVCALLALRDHFKKHSATAPSAWLGVMERIAAEDAQAPKRAPKDLLYFEIVKSSYDCRVEPYLLPIEHFDASLLDDRDALAKGIIEGKLWKHSREVISAQSLGKLLPAPALESAAIGLLASRWSRYDLPMNTVLPLLCESIVFYKAYGSHEERFLVTVRPEVASVEADIDRIEGGIRLTAHAAFGERRVTLKTGEAKVISDKPLWVKAGTDVFSVADNRELVRTQILSGGITVPERDEERFLEEHLPSLSQRMKIAGDAFVSTVDLTVEPVPRLYLSETEGDLAVELRFGYDRHEVPFQKTLPEVSVKYDAQTRELVRVHRDLVAEERSWKALSSHGLKRAVGGESMVLRQNTDPVDFLIRHVPKLADDGYEVYGEDEVKSVRVNRSKPSMSISVSSGIDWFDVLAVVNFGDLEVPLADIRRAVKKGEKYVKLCDDSIGEIPGEWIDRYKRLFDLAEGSGDGLRLTGSQVMLLDAALAEAESVWTDDEFDRRRARLKDVTRIEPKDVMAGFVGELRQYQKAGYDWLHFLHDFGLGGCLADDMGLGKTVQALAFLHSLRETGHTKSADLVVMPRSLLTNWEREAAKFTPSAKVLIHADLDRARNVSEFDGYDLVLTTYGIALRDLDILSKYDFHYVVLDESQAVKNPICQTGKAVRLLKSDHRLVMTGTPVENSTTELWSQFAFINPGMFGSLDYFRKEFATPIERGGDAEVARYLRGLVHPFILRRTKEQVAPELPAKNERIVYCELDAGQQKLYDQTRDRYRADLLGMIQDSGMQNARMKVLEGLLRLRQICNHPRLVDKAHKEQSAKLEVLIDEIETLRAEGHKALIFSQFTQMLKIVRNELDARKIPYAYLDGHTMDRQKQVDAFQASPDIPFFLISLKAGGVGLNLTAADYVIHIDPWWNPAVERQANDRTHRIGQEKPVFVNKLIARGTVEEKMLELQERKRDLVDRLIATESGFFKSLTADDVRDLFS